MREILFRGKRKDKGEWIEGCLVRLGRESFSDPERYGICNKAIPLGGSGVYYNLKINEVAPETVGQFTGLTDKNGKKIFEGDIVEFGEYRYTVEWKRDRCWFGYEETEDRMLECDGGHCVVVGDIFDNPELLKRGDR